MTISKGDLIRYCYCNYNFFNLEKIEKKNYTLNIKRECCCTNYFRTYKRNFIQVLLFRILDLHKIFKLEIKMEFLYVKMLLKY